MAATKMRQWISSGESKVRQALSNKQQNKHWIVTVSEAIFGSQSSSSSAVGLHRSATYLVVHYALRLIILILCLVGCFAQIGTIMRIYFSYPAIVFVDLHQMEKLLLPGITVCNDNRVMRSKLSAYDRKFATEWNKLINQTRQDKATKLYQQQLIDTIIRTMLTNLTVTDFMTLGNTADDFLDVNFFRCASDKTHPNQQCILLSNLLTTAQENGNCFTLFHSSNSQVLANIAINSGLSESAVVRGSQNESVNIEQSLKPFAPNEIIRFRVNFREAEYTTLNEPVSGRFIIHDNHQIAVIREKSYRIEPGKYYTFYLTKLTDELLPAPYFTDCRDYKIMQDSSDGPSPSSTSSSSTTPTTNSTTNEQVDATKAKQQQNETVNILFSSSPASKNNCIIGCIAKRTIATCNCWPPELPFLYTGMDNESISLLKWCDWRERPPIANWQQKPNHLTWFQYCFNVHEAECDQLCKSDCSIDRYRIIEEEIEWPGRERIEHSEESDELRRLRKCCAVISIRYWTSEQKINRYKPRFELAEFTSYIGGLLSMWLGFSIFGFYGLSENVVVRLVDKCLEKRQKKRDDDDLKRKQTLPKKHYRSTSIDSNNNNNNQDNNKNNKKYHTPSGSTYTYRM